MRPWSRERGRVGSMAGSGLPERAGRVAGGPILLPPCHLSPSPSPDPRPLPCLPHLHPQSQHQHLCLETMGPFQAWSSSLAFIPVSSPQTSPLLSPNCYVLRAQGSPLQGPSQPQQVSFSEPQAQRNRGPCVPCRDRSLFHLWTFILFFGLRFFFSELTF